jgi:hypothetical protein
MLLCYNLERSPESDRPGRRLRLALGMIIKLTRYSFFDSLYPALYTERYGSTLSAGN